MAWVGGADGWMGMVMVVVRSVRVVERERLAGWLESTQHNTTQAGRGGRHQRSGERGPEADGRTWMQ